MIVTSYIIHMRKGQVLDLLFVSELFQIPVFYNCILSRHAYQYVYEKHIISGALRTGPMAFGPTLSQNLNQLYAK